MKILSKAYLLIGVLIVVAAFNLFLLYQEGNSEVTQSYSIIKTGDVKVKAESISSYATSVANGNVEDKEILDREISNVQSSLEKIKNGGNIEGQNLERIPPKLLSDYNKVSASWENFKQSATTVEVTSVFDKDASSAINYVLQKNTELVLITDDIVNELSSLDRDYKEHKEIAVELAECAREIGQQTLLISIGEGEDVQETLKEKRLAFEIGVRQLAHYSLEDLPHDDDIHELAHLPRENSESLRKLEPLWESVQNRIQTLEERALLSPEFSVAKNQMTVEKEQLFSDIDVLLDSWNAHITSQGSEGQIIVQILLIVDIAVFFLVLFVIRQSLSPLESITQALSKVKEGIYGQKITYSGTDEVGQLVSSFNIMSDTIKEKEEEAKKTDVAKDEFLAMITHELKTPLVPIQGYSDILLSEHLGKLTGKQKERIEIIKASSEALLSIISDLLDAQKLELGQLRMRKEIGNIKETITHAINDFLPEAEKKNIEILSTVPDLQIEHDNERIRQVITNLIKNSLIAIQADSGKIEISMTDLPDKIKIHVKDSGVGIPQEKLDKLFKKFFQVDATLTRERGGSGLGLAICRGIITNHGGEINVENTSSQGTTFVFTIPKISQDSPKSPIGTT